MSGAGNDAPPINSRPSSQHHLLPDRTQNSVLLEDGLPRTTSDVAVQATHGPGKRDPERTMVRNEGSIEASAQQTQQPPKIRVYFDEFAAQIRLHRRQDRHSRVLRLRQESLQKSIALTERLRRVGRVVQDGLVELSGHNDSKSGFSRVYKCFNELSTTCHARWKSDIQAYDILTDRDTRAPGPIEERRSFVCKMGRESRKDLGKLLHSIRSDPRFLVDRIKALSQVQLDGICLVPGEEAQLSVLPTFPQNRNSRSQGRRNTAFVNSLEDFAISLERKEPLKFMLCHVFGNHQDPQSSEHYLRLDTWSSVCAELFLEPENMKYHKLIGRILYIFASFQPWRVAERLERYLMDILQRGAVLLEAVDKTPTSSFRSLSSEPLNTAEAEAFFEHAVQDLIAILAQHDGGFPPAALQFASAVIAKLPEQIQSDFGAHILAWFFGDFLAVVISYPENENMLLNCHISRHARSTVLSSLARKVHGRVWDVFGWNQQPCKEVPDTMRSQVQILVGLLRPLEIPEPSKSSSLNGDAIQKTQSPAESTITSSVVLCPTELINILDTLCPLPGFPSTGGFDPFLTSAASAFQNQYARTSTRSRTTFDQLRQELSHFSEPSLSSRLSHPGAEQWTVLPIDSDRNVDIESCMSIGVPDPAFTVEKSLLGQDATREAAIRLASEYRNSYRRSIRYIHNDPTTSGTVRESLLDLFGDEARYAQDRADEVDTRYWHNALQHLCDRYPLSNWASNDTKALRAPLDLSRKSQALLEAAIVRYENELLDLKDSFAEQRQLAEQILDRLGKIRTKLWYLIDVIPSSLYEDAKNIASALNSIAGSLLSPSENTSEHSETASLAGSILSQSSRETVGMLKAPSEHGGPRKLSDMQVDMIRKWLKRNNIENFCKGEERIHRFCMEIKLLSRKLAAETVSESPVLWSSELFAKEKSSYFDTSNFLLPGFGGTGTPSVRSETMSSTYHSSRGASHNMDLGLRLPNYDAHGSPARKSSFHSSGSARIRTDVQPVDGSSLNGSPDRAYSSAASDTIASLSSLWSPAAAQSQSATSISTRSRPPSTYNDIESAKSADQTARDKSKFLEELQQDLTCLLLSDLGCPVWSYGSETDAWLVSTSADSKVARRIRQRHTSVKLLSARTTSTKSNKALRSSSVAPLIKQKHVNDSHEDAVDSNDSLSFAYTEAYQNLLEKCSQHIDPVEKLQAIYDMKLLVVAEMEDFTSDEPSKDLPASGRLGRAFRSAPSSRRSSFDPSKPMGVQRKPIPQNVTAADEILSTSFVAMLHSILKQLTPKTLFRDLQYISVFVSQETLNKTPRGNALTDFGLAALAYKADTAQAMVDVADRVFADCSSKHSTASEISLQEPKYAEASTFLLIAAREGNAVAQREIAGLYLSHPEMRQVISLPLSFSGETFKKENEWQKRGEEEDKENISSQAMCLALHWMQQAATNGDKVAQDRVEKRDEGISIRLV